MTHERLREDALMLFHEGLAAVDPRNAVQRWVHAEGGPSDSARAGRMA